MKYRITIGLTIAAVTCFAAPVVIIILPFTVIGIPISLLILAAPTLLIFHVLGEVGRYLAGWLGYALGATIALVILAAPSSKANIELAKKASNLSIEDHDNLLDKITARTIAVIREDDNLDKSHFYSRCDDFCRKMLLNSQAERIFIVNTKILTGHIDDQQLARSFRMERRENCPSVNFNQGGWTLDKTTTNSNNSIDVMQLEIAQGNCLIEEASSLHDADLVISAIPIARGPDPYGAGFDISANTIKANRVTVQARENNKFIEIFKKTGIYFYKLAPILVPTQIPGYGLDTKPGFVRFFQNWNLPHGHTEIDLADFLKTKLGFNLQIKTERLDENRISFIENALNKSGELSSTVQNVADDLVEAIVRKKNPSTRELIVIKNIFKDKRLFLPPSATRVIYSAKGAPDDYFKMLSQAALDRIEEITKATGESTLSKNSEEQLQRAGSLIGYSPTQFETETSRIQLEKLAQNRVARVPAYKALYALSNFGAEAVPTLLFLISDAKSYAIDLEGKKYWRTREGEKTYLAGLVGLCLGGDSTKAAIPELVDKLRSGDLPTHSTYGSLTRLTLRSLGMSNDALWDLWQSIDRSLDRRSFNSEILKPLNRNECKQSFL